MSTRAAAPAATAAAPTQGPAASPAAPPAAPTQGPASPPATVVSSPPVVVSSPPVLATSTRASPTVVSTTPVVSVSPSTVTTPTTSQIPVVTTTPTTTVTPTSTVAPPPTSNVQSTTVRPTSNTPAPATQPTPTPQPSPTPPQTTAAPPRSTVTTPDFVTITANQVTQSSGAPPITSTLTSVFSSELISTEADGLVVTTTLESTIIIVPTGVSSSKSSSTGAIVGGVAGGIAVLAAAIIIFFFYLRRNRRREEFDGNFDPDRVVRHGGHTDLAGAEVTPYSYDPPSTALSGPTSGPTSPTFSADGSMRQYRDSRALLGSTYEGVGGATGTSGSHYAPTSSDGASAPPGSLGHGRSNSHGSAGLAPGFPLAQPYRPLSSKELEMSRQRGEGGLGLASAIEEGEGEVIQHSDGGRITEPVPPSRPPQEIPPSYYSISGNP
ncbi:hypothetical protein F5888DRAFT_1637705 [Russula emetica]|nr:hypothetical protein F5888DRAFT_1637705 [Russula emetica]